MKRQPSAFIYVLAAFLATIVSLRAAQIPELPELGIPAGGDYLYIVDVSDLTDGVHGSGRKITLANVSLALTPDWNNLLNKPTTISGYGITDAVTLTGIQTLANKTLATPTLTMPALGAATATSINGLTLTPTTGTITLANGKTLAATNTLTLSGTDGTTMTFPATSATILGSAAQPLTTSQQQQVKRNLQAAETPVQAGCAVIFVGDSITVNLYVTAGHEWTTLIYADPLFADRAPISATNHAVTGETMTQIDARYMSEVYPHRPAVNGGDGPAQVWLFMVNVGTNQGTLNSANTFALIDSYRTRAIGDGFTVVSSTLMHTGSDYDDDLNKRIRKARWPYCAELAGLGTKRTSPDYTDYFQPDQIHQSDLGAYIVYRELATTIRTQKNNGQLQGTMSYQDKELVTVNSLDVFAPTGGAAVTLKSLAVGGGKQFILSHSDADGSFSLYYFDGTAYSVPFLIDSNKKVAIGIGSTPISRLNRVVKSAYDFGTITAGTPATTTVTITGAAPGDDCVLTRPAGLDVNINIFATITSANTVTITAVNRDLVAPHATGAKDYPVTVTKY